MSRWGHLTVRLFCGKAMRREAVNTNAILEVGSKMSEFEAEVKKAEMELEQSLVPLNTGEKVTDDEF